MVVGVLYYLLQFFKSTLGAAAPWAVGGTLLAMYLYAARGGPQPRSAGRHRRQQPQAAGDLAHGARGAALHHSHRRADLVFDGRRDVARALGLLGRHGADRADADAAPLDRLLSWREDARRLAARLGFGGAGLQRRRPQHDRHRHLETGPAEILRLL